MEAPRNFNLICILAGFQVIQSFSNFTIGCGQVNVSTKTDVT